jgi:hypothetical protein
MMPIFAALWVCQGLAPLRMLRVETYPPIRSVAHQAAGSTVGALGISCGNSGARRQGGQLHAATGEEPLGSNKESVGALALKQSNGRRTRSPATQAAAHGPRAAA